MRLKTSLHTLLLFMPLVIVACGGGGGSSSSKSATPTATPTPSPEPGPQRPSNTGCIPPEPVIEPGTIGIAAAFPNLPATNEAMAMVQPANDSSFWFLAARGGFIYRFDNDSSADMLTEVLDLSGKLASTDGTEYGLSGLAFHPNYPSDARVFVLYNDGDNAARSTLSEFTLNTSTGIINASSETVLLTLDQPIPFHNGGDLSFGPDGMLYAAFGDGEFQAEAQLTSSLYGSLIRIDVSTAPYTIPSDNPLNTGQARCNSTQNSDGQVCPEIYAYGFRNPWRFSIDFETGNPWVGDVGESDVEEVNRVISGGNYGWSIYEGDICTSGSCDPDGFEAPISVYPNSGGASVIGGYVYRGSQSPSLVGQYIFGDIYSSNFYSVAATATAGTSASEIFNAERLVYAMAQGNDGELYLLSAFAGNGEMIYRISDGSNASYSMPDTLSETGCFNTSAKTSTSGVFDYENISPLWSDGADKLRSFAIPDATDITVLADGEFRFPNNSVLIKHFLNGSTYLETRLLVRHPDGWQGYSYEWNDAQTEANLLTDGKTKDVGDFVHTYPSPSQCAICHIGTDNSLGIETLQLNRNSNRNSAALDMNIVDYLNDAGYFTSAQDSSTLDNLFALDDDSATLEQRARSYLHSNCSGCHRPDAGNRVSIDLRFSTALADTDTCGIAASLGDLGVSGAQRIFPGNADASVIVLRMETLESDNRMPPLASLAVDTDAVQVVRDWINSLQDCD